MNRSIPKHCLEAMLWCGCMGANTTGSVFIDGVVEKQTVPVCFVGQKVYYRECRFNIHSIEIQIYY